MGYIWTKDNLMGRYSEGLYSGGKSFNLQSVKLVLFLFSCTKFVFLHISRRWICEICSKLAIKTLEYVTLMIKLTKKTPRRRSCLFIANSEHVPLFFTGFSLLSLISQLPTGVIACCSDTLCLLESLYAKLPFVDNLSK